MKNVVLFASGSGSNAENIIIKLKQRSQDNAFTIFTNNPDAKVLEKAKNLHIPFEIFNKSELLEGLVLKKLIELKPDLIVLAGFLLKFPENIVKHYPNKIINIHPALLPKHGGKGMYGMNVHETVFNNKETETGITIHYVNENYDEGKIIFQKSVSVTNCKTREEIAQKVLTLEHEYFPEVIFEILNPKF
ncbi:phosphoribosylglycinamide formyltransferase [Flavobacterium sp.]|uniref:phosphoribosylglycinamide formyltransferase n=1 Tax=Flavobacterium sp. TaxID=239 RepID=UPI0037525F27